MNTPPPQSSRTGPWTIHLGQGVLSSTSSSFDGGHLRYILLESKHACFGFMRQFNGYLSIIRLRIGDFKQSRLRRFPVNSMQSYHYWGKLELRESSNFIRNFNSHFYSFGKFHSMSHLSTWICAHRHVTKQGSTTATF